MSKVKKEKRKCSVPGCGKDHHSYGYCKTHRRQSVAGKIIIEETMDARKKLIKEVAAKGDYKSDKAVVKAGKTEQYVVTAFNNDTLNIKAKNSDFISRDGNMRIKELMEKEQLIKCVDSKYFVFASVVTQWAINSKDCIVRCPDYNGNIPATDEMLRREFSKFTPGNREMSKRYFNDVMKHLTERGIIYKMSMTKLGMISYQYLANPLFVPSVLNELSTTLFLVFHDQIAKKINNHAIMSEMFSLCLKNTAWSQKCIDLEIKGDKAAADELFVSNIINLVKELEIEDRVKIIDNTSSIYERLAKVGKTVMEMEESRKKKADDLEDDDYLNNLDLDIKNEQPNEPIYINTTSKTQRTMTIAEAIDNIKSKSTKVITVPRPIIKTFPAPKTIIEEIEEVKPISNESIFEESVTCIPEKFKNM